MLTYAVKPILELMHFIHKASVFLLTTSCIVGRTIFLLLLKICNIISDTFSALAIIGEELYHFLCELNASVLAVSQYIQTSANGGINSVIEGVSIFCRQLCKFFINTKIHSKLLATKLGCFVCDFLGLIKSALLLIADCGWWLLTLVPRWLGYIIITVGDFIVNTITVIRKSIVYTITVVVEDIFRLTIGVVLLVLLWHNRRRLGLFLLKCFLNLKRMLLLCYGRLFRRRNQHSVIRTTPTRSRLPRQNISPSSSEKSFDPNQRCVVCRDQQKCVLLLPCKHLCLCEECADYIIFTAQRQICPLCRTDIVHSMSVYT